MHKTYLYAQGKKNEIRHIQARNKLDAASKSFSTFLRRIGKGRLISKEMENVQLLKNVQLLAMLYENDVSQADLRTFYDILQKCYFEPAGLDEVACCG